MALPLSVNNLAGTLVLASSASTGGSPDVSGDLNLPIGTSIAAGQSASTTPVQMPGVPMDAIFLVQLSSGSATLIADTTSDGSTPTFASSKAVTVNVTHGEPVYVGPIATAGATQTNTNGVLTTTAATNMVALKITNNNASVAETVSALRLLTLVVIGKKNEWYSVHTGSMGAGAPFDSVVQGDGSGTFVLNT